MNLSGYIIAQPFPKIKIITILGNEIVFLFPKMSNFGILGNHSQIITIFENDHIFNMLFQLLDVEGVKKGLKTHSLTTYIERHEGL